MCGIVGYVGSKGATPMLIEGLKRLEYRGYDSAGIAMMNGHGLETRKAKGKISMLEGVVHSSPINGSVGIAHTRWATHGPPNVCNAHPHTDCKNEIAVVHNGIIENFGELREALKQQGFKFESETDTEVVAHLVTREMKKGLGPVEAVAATLPLLARARKVQVISIGEQPEGTAEALKSHLSRHGISAAYRSVAPVEGVGAGGQLLSEARDAGADLLIMGAYGHRPWREFLFGGATKEIVATSRLPVLLMH